MSADKIHLILDDASEKCDSSLVGGKAHNLWELKNRLSHQQCLVPPWFCVTTSAFQQFIKVWKIAKLFSPNDMRGLIVKPISIDDHFMGAPYEVALPTKFGGNQ